MDFGTKSIALQRIQRLFFLARKIVHADPALAQRYIRIARRVAMAAKIRLPKEYRQQVCKTCKSFILPGVNCRIRIRQKRESHLVITCLNCGEQMRIPLKKVKERAKS